MLLHEEVMQLVGRGYGEDGTIFSLICITYIYRVGQGIVDCFFAETPLPLLGTVSGKINQIC